MALINDIKDNWAGRSGAEQVIIGLVGSLFLCTVFYLVIAQPLMDWRDQQNRQLKANSKILSQVDSLVERYRQAGENPQKTQGLAGLIDQSLRAHGLTMKGFQPGKDNDARLSLHDVQYKPLISWLHDVEYKHYLVVEEFSLIQVKKTGLLSAKIRLRQ